VQVSPLFLESLPGAVDALPAVAGIPAVASVPTVAGFPSDTGALTIVVDAIKLIRLPK
jgi:hypothetical protein